jgi:hypothetical protein
LNKARIKSSITGAKKYLGDGRYKAIKNGVAVIYVKKGAKKIILTSYREK